jgi:hypothetical protein
MKYFVTSLYLLGISISSLSADLIILSNGGSKSGQLLKVSGHYLIFEVLNKSGQVSTISLHRDEVNSVIDESDEILYEKGRLIERDLEDYYQKSFPRYPKHSSQRDTIVFKNGDELVVNIISTHKNYVTYKRPENPGNRLYTTTIDRIKTINGKFVRNTIDAGSIFESSSEIRVFHYPHPFIEIGFSLIHQQLNQYQSIVQEVIDQVEAVNYGTIREINNPLVAVNLGFGLKFSQAFSLACLADFNVNFGDNRDYSEHTEHFRLFLAEFRYTYPLKFFDLWLGAGAAWQSITLINRFHGVDMKYTSSLNTIAFGIGIKFKFNTQFSSLISLRYLPFGEQDVYLDTHTHIFTNSRIDHTNIIFSTTILVNL